MTALPELDRVRQSTSRPGEEDSNAPTWYGTVLEDRTRRGQIRYNAMPRPSQELNGLQRHDERPGPRQSIGRICPAPDSDTSTIHKGTRVAEAT